MDVFGLTDTGAVRRMNQDVFAVEEVGPARVLVVCDGMGGARAGEIASALACETFLTAMRADEDVTEAALCRRLRTAVVRAGDAVYTRSVDDPDCAGMGTTLVAAAVTENLAVVANVGDSRAYHLADGELTRVTRDHSVVEDLIERGELTREAAKNHPSRNLITRVLGASGAQRPDLFRVSMEPGGALLLCSDGLSNVLSDAELSEALGAPEEASVLCRRLVDTALERGAPDNVTAVILKLPPA